MDAPSVRERLRYKHISWLMPNVDVPMVLDKLGVSHEGVRGNEVRGFCPDHHLYTGRQPSHPFWTVNVDSGETYCFTEGRGSNLLWIVRRLLECKADEAAQFISGATGATISDLELAGLRNRLRHMRKEKTDDEGREVSGLGEIGADIAARPTSKRLYEFFASPPGKKPTDIAKDTVDRFEVFERTWGYYCDRAIIPIRHDSQLVGFCAVDILGEKAWHKKHPTSEDYRKTLYPLGFGAADCLYGYDDCEAGSERVILVEDARSKMKLWQEGYPSCCAILGAELHGPQIRLLATLSPKEVVVMLDGDVAGREATERAVRKLLKNFVVRPCYVPIGKDPKNLCGNEIEAVMKKSKLAVAKS
jgi:hypothetical protein